MMAVYQALSYSLAGYCTPCCTYPQQCCTFHVPLHCCYFIYALPCWWCCCCNWYCFGHINLSGFGFYSNRRCWHSLSSTHLSRTCRVVGLVSCWFCKNVWNGILLYQLFLYLAVAEEQRYKLEKIAVDWSSAKQTAYPSLLPMCLVRVFAWLRVSNLKRNVFMLECWQLWGLKLIFRKRRLTYILRSNLRDLTWLLANLKFLS